jgi:ketosteroid isomerase-like protein
MTPMSNPTKPGGRGPRKIFPTPEDAEAAFYDAFERCNLAAMMAVWSSEDHAVCIHPGGARLAGFEAIRASWTEIFAGGPGFKMKVSEVRAITSQTLAIRMVYETLVPEGGEASATPTPILATNIFALTPNGWRMVLHHASPAPAGTTAEEQGTGRVLH